MDDRPATVMGARYWAEGERPWHVYSDGRELTSADGIGEGSLQFSADGQRLGWVEVVDGEGFIVIDGRRYGPYQDIEPGSMQVSDSGATFIALCGDEWKKIAVPVARDTTAICSSEGTSPSLSHASRRQQCRLRHRTLQPRRRGAPDNFLQTRELQACCRCAQSDFGL